MNCYTCIIPDILFVLEYKTNPAMEDVLAKAIEYFENQIGLIGEKIPSITRKREYVEARHFIMNYSYKRFHYALKEIGEVLSGRDHTTVIHGIQTLNDLCDTDLNYKKKYQHFSTYMNINL